MTTPTDLPGINTYFPWGRFRIHPDPSHAALKVQLSRVGDDWWLVQPDLPYQVGVPNRREADLYEGQMKDGSIFVLVMPYQDGVESEMRATARQAVELARSQWVSVEWAPGGPGVRLIPEPSRQDICTWPNRDFVDTVALAFQGRMIFTPLDVVVRLSLAPEKHGPKACHHYRQQMQAMLN